MELLYFIIGALFIQAILPILDGFCNLLLTWIEAKKAKYNDIINQINIKIRQAAAADSDSSSRAIGFRLPDDEEEDEEDEI